MTSKRFAVVAWVFVLSVSAVAAHDLGAQAKFQDGEVLLEAYYDDDTAASQAKVRVVDGTGAVVAQGITDDHGQWKFAAPPGRYRMTVDAGGGHRTSIVLTIPEQAGLSTTAPAPSAKPRLTAVTEQPIVSSGPSRQEFTQFPWLRLGMGLVVLVGLAGLARWWLSVRPSVSSDKPQVSSDHPPVA